MATKKTSEQRHSIEAQLAVAEQALATARADHSLHSLRLAQGAPDALAEVEGREREIAIHEKTIARLRAAQAAEAKAITVEDRAAADALEVERLAKVQALASDIEANAVEIVAAFDALAPLLAKADRLQRERASLASSLLHGTRLSENRLNGYRNQLGVTSAQVILAAIATSGLGRTGPRLDPHVAVSTGNFGLPETALSKLRLAHEREHHSLLEVTGRLAKAEATTVEGATA